MLQLPSIGDFELLRYRKAAAHIFGASAPNNPPAIYDLPLGPRLLFTAARQGLKAFALNYRHCSGLCSFALPAISALARDAIKAPPHLYNKSFLTFQAVFCTVYANGS